MKTTHIYLLSLLLLLLCAMPCMAEYTSPRLDSLQRVEEGYKFQVEGFIRQQDSVYDILRYCKTDSARLVQHAVLKKIEKNMGQIAKRIDKVQKESEIERERLIHHERDSILSEKHAQVQALSAVPLRGEHSGHPWVDLGLPSGTKWATYNVGTAHIHGVGTRISWGELASKKTYSPATSKYHDTIMPPYAGDPLYDIATARWGEGWSTPTKQQWEELVEYCDWEFIMINGIYGVIFTSRKTYNYIFLPSTGYTDDYSYKLKYTTYNQAYWSSSGFDNDGAYAYFSNYERGFVGSCFKYLGLCVRAVCNVL